MNICQKCFDDMRMITDNEGTLYFRCDDCGNEDRDWVKVDKDGNGGNTHET